MIHGKTYLTPRLTAWYGKKQGRKMTNPLTTAPEEIKQRVEKETGISFNSVLLNLYRTGRDSRSFLLMAGPMQHYWEHQIPKTTREIKPRINLTFRISQE